MKIRHRGSRSLYEKTFFGINETYAVLLNMYISHPVYIIVLSGFAQLKEHFVRLCHELFAVAFYTTSVESF